MVKLTDRHARPLQQLVRANAREYEFTEHIIDQSARIPSESTDNYDAEVLIYDPSMSRDYEQFGPRIDGDLVGVMVPDETRPSRGDTIEYGGDTYEVTTPPISRPSEDIEHLIFIGFDKQR